jgi:hypothetical protein
MKGTAPLARGNRAARRDALRIRNIQIVYENRGLMPAIQPITMTTEPLRTQISSSFIDKYDPRNHEKPFYETR